MVSENAGDLILTAEFEASRRQRNLTLHVVERQIRKAKEELRMW
jgi:hypothetical protein